MLLKASDEKKEPAMTEEMLDLESAGCVLEECGILT